MEGGPVKHFIYIIGEPGSGKSTLVAALLKHPGIAHDKPFAFIQYPGGIELGARREKFSGTDALPMNVQPKVVEWLKGQLDETIVLGEGDRLANLSFFSAAQGAGYNLMVYHLWVPLHIGEMRRKERGSDQNEAWIMGRITKIQNLVKRLKPETLDGRKSIEELVYRLRKNPIIERLCRT
jgi:energy-coupling factor transporter ATP-binding protein EcfA2